ncbi:hypothetical protein OT109_15665 [Phycisphaeraceae bacterium D3-23]
MQDESNQPSPPEASGHNARATVANGYRWRLIIIGVVMVGFSGWAVYDATINYPKKQELRETFEREVSGAEPDQRLTAWAKYAGENGLDKTEPEALSEFDILTQWLLFGISFPIGAYHLVQWFLWSRKFIEGDDDGVRAHGDTAFTWEQVTAVDANKWDRKGIAYIEYDAGKGNSLLVLDDWKYEREPADAVFALLQEYVDADKIDGLKKPAAAEAADDDVDATAGVGAVRDGES